MMKPSFQWAGILLFLMVVVLHADDKKKLPTFYLKPGQITDYAEPIPSNDIEDWKHGDPEPGSGPEAQIGENEKR